MKHESTKEIECKTDWNVIDTIVHRVFVGIRSCTVSKFSYFLIISSVDTVVNVYEQTTHRTQMAVKNANKQWAVKKKKN